MAQNKQLKFFSTQGKNFFRLNEEVKKLSDDRHYHLSLRLILFTFIASGGLLVGYYWRLPARVPFYYSQPWGESQLASRKHLIFMFLFLVLMTVINILVASKKRLDSPIMANIFVWVTLMLWLMGLISLIKIYSIFLIW